MTNKEIISSLRGLIGKYDLSDDEWQTVEQAINVLSNSDGDCISRQAVIDAIDKWVKDMGVLIALPADEVTPLFDSIHKLPPVTPQPKVGEWLEKEVISDKVIEEWQSARCSACDKYHTTPYMYYFDNYKFCPNCGARLEEVET